MRLVLIVLVISKRETELIHASREVKEAKDQLKDLLQRADSNHMVSGTERAQQAQGLDDLRTKLDAAMAAKEEALTQLAVAEEKVKTRVTHL